MENENQQPSEPNKTEGTQQANAIQQRPTSNNMTVLVIALVLVVVAGLAGYQFLGKHTASTQQYAPSVNIQPTAMVKKPASKTNVIRRSRAPGKVVTVVVATKIDPKTGKPLVPSKKIPKNTRHIYVVMQLNPTISGKRLAYVLYKVKSDKNNTFLGYKTLPLKPNAQYTVFDFSLKGTVQSRPTGTYFLKIYTDGKLEKTTTYTVTDTIATNLIATTTN